MKRFPVTLALLAAAAALPGAAAAATFTLNYSAFFASQSDAITTTATLTADPDAFTTGQWDITAISGTRGGAAITGFDSFYNVFYYPAAQPAGYSFQTYLDDVFAEITYTAGGVDYNLYRGSGDTDFYHEFDGSTGRLISAANFTIAQAAAPSVPEPTSWAMMIGGFGLIGGVARAKARRTMLRFA